MTSKYIQKLPHVKEKPIYLYYVNQGKAGDSRMLIRGAKRIDIMYISQKLGTQFFRTKLTDDIVIFCSFKPYSGGRWDSAPLYHYFTPLERKISI